MKILHIELCEYVSLLYLDLHFDDYISWSYGEGIQRFWEGAEGGVAIVGFVKEIGGGKSEVNAFGKEPADRGIEENDAGGLVGGETRVIMLCAESNMPLVSRQECNGEVLAQCTVDGLYCIDLVLVVCVSQAIVSGEPASEFARELGRKSDEGGGVRLFHVLLHHPGAGVPERRINAYSDFSWPKTFADAAIELGDRDVVSTIDKSRLIA